MVEETVDIPEPGEDDLDENLDEDLDDVDDGGELEVMVDVALAVVLHAVPLPTQVVTMGENT